jgi:sorting nexin-3/12
MVRDWFIQCEMIQCFIGLFDDEFIDERKKGLEEFLNKVAGHPLAQNERCLHMFLQDPIIDRNYVPGKVRINN